MENRTRSESVSVSGQSTSQWKCHRHLTKYYNRQTSGAWGCFFFTGINRFRRGQRVRLDVQRTISAVAPGVRFQVKDRRSTQNSAALATKDCTELRQYQGGQNKHWSKQSFNRLNGIVSFFSSRSPHSFIFIRNIFPLNKVNGIVKNLNYIEIVWFKQFDYIF